MHENSVQAFRDALTYERDTGVLRWAIDRAPVRAGAIAGHINSKGYLIVKAFGRTHQVHRLIWLLVNGAWPSQQIDHINGDRADNRWINLRDVSPSHNMQNRRRGAGACRLLGVSRNQGRFMAAIRVDGKQKNLGRFNTPEEAHAAYLSAKRALHPGFAL